MTVNYSPPKDPGLAAVLELVGTLFAIPGIGWMYAGQFTTGITIFGAYWAFIIVAFVVYFAVTFVTLGCGAFTILLFFPLPVFVGATSAKKVHDYVNSVNNPATAARRVTPPPSQSMPPPAQVIVKKTGLQPWQVFILIVLAVIATTVCLCGGLVSLGLAVQPPA
jgi:TM2 domain-containing membrane protein YozV